MTPTQTPQENPLLRKVERRHVRRDAYLYVRQSTMC
jgi:hypothetical protein